MQLTQAQIDMVLSYRLLKIIFHLGLGGKITDEAIDLYEATAPYRHLADIYGVGVYD